VVIAAGSAALVFVLALTEPVAAQPETGSGDRVPSELWRTYPLEPRRGEARIRSAKELEQPQASRPGSDDAPAVRDPEPAEGQRSVNEDGSSAAPAFALFLISLLGLMVVVLVARAGVAVGRHVPDSFARVGSSIASPVRAVAAAPRSRLLRSAVHPAAGPAGARSHRGSAARRHAVRRLSSRAGAEGAAGLGRTGGRVVRLPLRVGAAVGAAVRTASLGVVSKRGEIVLYALVAVASVAVGIALASFLSSG